MQRNSAKPKKAKIEGPPPIEPPPITDVFGGTPAQQMQADMEKDAINRGEDVGDEVL